MIKPKFLLFGIACLSAVLWWITSPLTNFKLTGFIKDFLSYQPAVQQASPKEPGTEAVFAIAGLVAVAYLVLRQRQ